MLESSQTENGMDMERSKMRIAMLGHKRVPSREGGVEIVVEELSVRMAEQGHAVTCFNRGGHHVSGKEYDRAKEKSFRGVRLKEVLTIDRKGLAAVSSSFFAALRSAFGFYDVVHIHAEGPAFMCWLPRLLGKRVVVTIHGLDWQRAKWGRFASWYIRTGEKNAARFAHEVIVLSQGAKDYFKETYDRETRFIPNGVSRPVCREASIIREKWGLEKDGYILFLGRLVPEKGIHYLIEGFSHLNTDKKLVIAGGSSDTAEYADRLRQMAGGNVLFTGPVEGETLDELYSNAYLYCLPSDVEGMPLSLLEAMSYGNCCLTSDIEACTSVVEDHALRFRQGDTKALAEQLQSLCDHPEGVEAFRRGAAEYVLNRYNWDRITQETLELYHHR